MQNYLKYSKLSATNESEVNTAMRVESHLCGIWRDGSWKIWRDARKKTVAKHSYFLFQKKSWASWIFNNFLLIHHKFNLVFLPWKKRSATVNSICMRRKIIHIHNTRGKSQVEMNFKTCVINHINRLKEKKTVSIDMKMYQVDFNIY